METDLYSDWGEGSGLEVWLDTEEKDFSDSHGSDYDGEEVEDPHGDAELSLFKYKGLKIGHFTDEMAYSACLCHERDVKKWTKIIKDMGEEDYLY